MTDLPIEAGRVAVVIATHTYCYPLERCVAGFARQMEDSADVILVDNGSGGSVRDWALVHVPFATLIERTENGFFCGGYNEGMRFALDRDYEYVLIVNADTEVCNEHLLSELLTVAQRHPKAAFIGPRVYLREYGRVQNTVLTFPRFSRNAVEFLRQRALGGSPIRSDRHEREVDFLNGVCVLCRVSALQEVGLLDELMGGYVEDTDWAWRARQIGWSSVYAPIDGIIHHQPELGYEHYSMKCFMLRRNTIYWHIKRGAQVEALLYGWCARWLAWQRAVQARLQRREDSAAFYRYWQRLSEVDRSLRQGRPIGPWFGPPVGVY